MSLTPEEELILLLQSDIDQKLKIPALEYILGVTGTDDGLSFLLKDGKVFKSLAALLNTESEAVLTPLLKCLVNLTSVESEAMHAELLLKEDFVTRLLTLLVQNNTCAAVAMILSNVTRHEKGSELVLKQLDSVCDGVRTLIDLLCKGKLDSSYHHVASVLANLTQITSARRQLLDDRKLIKEILPFTKYMPSEVRRLGIVGTIKNCCFDMEHHKLLLDNNLDLLATLLLPLAGPEEFDEDETDKLPMDLQYLDDDKKRDPNVDVRLMLLEALTQLCATKEGRRTMKDKNVYLILRELHKWEQVPRVTVACENLVDILIGDEPPQGMENLREVDIPTEMVEKFERMDKELLEIS